MEITQNKWEFATLASYEQFIFQLLEENEFIADPLLDWEDALLDNNFLLRQSP
ncbi:short-chain dehydrogenase [Aphanothece sacrum]|uniref:Short-chain dehydrogenase/reductase SDR n=1 Tax=Aphanothece sacrum FPU1 TaxID=1920663 RepID=A0A401IEW5_APHSA|nr:short-chain dehydrogenase [Aphanothece sacrum]GBF79766.1 short-chain dehydrogenase/reductase SDR [Aphanothece sacrum FPU1]GBF84778.1 short-chain dehydrogenase/reductase SDR [Aphanothece sacrum FPU3]